MSTKSMATESTDPATTIAEIHSTPVEEITEEQIYRWHDELLARKTNANTDEEFEDFEQLSDAMVKKLCESIDSLPLDEQDEVRRRLPNEKLVVDLADNIEAARVADDLGAVRMAEKLFQQAFALTVITKH